jgi:hypothetical protein
VLSLAKPQILVSTLAMNDYKTVYAKEIEFTDFPLTEITLFFANGVIYLPSEH